MNCKIKLNKLRLLAFKNTVSGPILGFRLTFLALLQRPDGLPALVLREQVLAGVVVGVGRVEARLQQKVTPPVPENL